MIDIQKELVGNKERCCGCGACLDVCPQNAIILNCDERGFYFPEVIKNKCVKCLKCIRECAFKTVKDKRKETSIPDVYAVQYDNMDDLIESSSGAVFPAIYKYVLKNNGVVCGAVLDENLKVRHYLSDSLSEYELMRGSKYAQSMVVGIYQQVFEYLNSNKMVLFSGTPCQVDALRQFLYLRKNQNMNRLITCDVICHGVVSPLMLKEYFKYIEKRTKKRIINHTFRKKVNGWDHIECNYFSDNTYDFASYDSQLHKRVFYADLAERDSCYVCPYATITRHSDLTLGDFWGIKDKYPELYDKRGVSLVLVNSDKGKEVLNNTKPSLKCVKVDINEAIKKQPQLLKPVHKNRFREDFWALYNAKGYYRAVKKYVLPSIKARVTAFLVRLGLFDSVYRIYKRLRGQDGRKI